MKKLLLLLLVLVLVTSLATSCSVLDGILDSLGASTQSGEDESYTYTDFTRKEKDLFNTYIGAVIPFIPCDEYYVEGYESKDDFENGINYYTFGNTEEEFENYRALYSDYELCRTEVDEYGDTWYCYVKGDVEVALSYYTVSGVSWVDVLVSRIIDEDGGESDPEGGNTPDSGDENGSGEGNGNTPGSGEENGSGEGNGNTPGSGEGNGHLYTDFTASEKDLFNQHFGFVIPFIANSDYELEELRDEYGEFLNFYTFGNTAEEYNAYRSTLASTYTFVESYEDEYGDTCYVYSQGDVIIDVAYYETQDSGWCIDIYIYEDADASGGGNTPGSGDDGGNSPDSDEDGENTPGSGDDGGNSPDSDEDGENTPGSGEGNGHLYTDFTASEKDLFNQYFGFVIPFIANSDYELEELRDEYGEFLNFYTFGNTAEEYNAYRATLASTYTFVESYEDEYGDTCYVYSQGDIMIDITYYESLENGWCVDIYIYEDTETSGGSGGNIGSNPGSGEGGYDPTVDVITNEGAGLPTPGGDGGSYSVDLSLGNIENVTEHGYYEGGCPTTGRPGVLVIPVEFSDVTAASKGYSIDAIKNAFLEGGVNDYVSVYDYYLASSYGKLELDITVLDSWFKPQYSSSYYENQQMEYGGEYVAIGDQIILDEALKYLEGRMDLSRFDSDGNGMIDAVVLINTLDIDSDAEDIFHWAYRYWNIYTDTDGYYYEYDNVSANDYLWASYQFLFESESGSFDDRDAVNTYTYIHEFGHVLGLDDYYDTAYIGDGLHLLDMMDATSGDHNPYSKFNLGWITSTRLVITLSETTLDLYAFGIDGDTIILANDWSDELGVYQEYYVLMYYRNTGLNAIDGAGYFKNEGIVVYRVEASLYCEEYDGTLYYDVYNNNTHPSDPDETERNLIELVLSSDGDFLFEAGEELPEDLTDWGGDALGYTFTVDSLGEEYATITFEKLAA